MNRVSRSLVPFNRLASVILATCLLFADELAHAADGAGSVEPSVIMVCRHGSAKSLMAASFFNRAALVRGLPFRAISRGIAPDAKVPARIVDALHGDGIDVAAYQPRGLTRQELAQAAYVVAIGDDVSIDTPTNAAAVVQQWNDVPSTATDFPASRQALLAHIDALLDRLEQQSRK